MRWSFALVPVVVFLAGCGAAPDVAPGDEFKLPDPPATDAALQGNWKLVRFDRFGGRCECDSVGKTWEITDKQIIAPEKAMRSVEGSYRVRPLELPRHIDIKTPDGQKMPGIYSIERDTLKLCIDGNGSQRPTTLESQGKSEIWLFVFERVKPAVVQAKAE